MMTTKPTFRWDTSSLALVLANVFTLVFALLGQWTLAEAMWVYWGQSVVIGFFNFCRILCLKEFSTEGVQFNGHSVPPTKATQRKVAWFFAMHYGFFHFVYLIFLFAERSDLTRPDVIGVVICVVVFAVNHAFSFRHNLKKDLARKPNIGTVMFFPYARIIPMHLTILFGSFCTSQSKLGMALFMSLKTVADLIMHVVEHWQRHQPTDTPSDV